MNTVNVTRTLELEDDTDTGGTGAGGTGTGGTGGNLTMVTRDCVSDECGEDLCNYSNAILPFFSLSLLGGVLVRLGLS